MSTLTLSVYKQVTVQYMYILTFLICNNKYKKHEKKNLYNASLKYNAGKVYYLRIIMSNIMT
jgi:hypothetical protein